MKRLLLVDDEVQILKSLTRLFIDTDYDVLTAENGEDALKILENEEIDLLISDMRMPYMDGYQLLCKVKEKYPKVLRMILSGYAEEKQVFKSLQQNVAKLYMFKPWNNNLLLKQVEQIFETEDLLASSGLLTLINNIEELPTIKSSYQKIIGMIENDADIIDISKQIERDQSISTKILHIANAAFYGARTGSVNQAVKYLGLQSIRSLILSTSIIDAMEVSGVVSDLVERLWKHAFITNKVLFFIYEKCLQKKLPEEASSAGLLHNIGTVFLMKYFFQRNHFLRRKALKEKLDLLQLERSEFKVTHQETGGYLLRWWELPYPIVEAALFHHDPFNKRIVNTELICCVHIAQRYAWSIMKEPLLTEFYIEAFRSIGVNQEEFEEKIGKMNWN